MEVHISLIRRQMIYKIVLTWLLAWKVNNLFLLFIIYRVSLYGLEADFQIKLYIQSSSKIREIFIYILVLMLNLMKTIMDI